MTLPAPRRPAGRGSGWGRSGCPSRPRAASPRGDRPGGRLEVGEVGRQDAGRDPESLIGLEWSLQSPRIRPWAFCAASAREHRVGPVPVWPQLQVVAGRAVADRRAGAPPVIQHLDVVRPARDPVDHVRGLPAVRRAGDVRDHAARPGASSAEASSAAAGGRGSRSSGVAPPARLRTAPERAQAAAGERRRSPGRTSPARHDGRVPSPPHDRRPARRHEGPTQPGTARCGATPRDQHRAPLAGQTGEHRRLASRPGTEVEPRTVRDRPARARARGDQLGALVLNARPGLRTAGKVAPGFPRPPPANGDQRPGSADAVTHAAQPARDARPA